MVGFRMIIQSLAVVACFVTSIAAFSINHNSVKNGITKNNDCSCSLSTRASSTCYRMHYGIIDERRKWCQKRNHRIFLHLKNNDDNNQSYDLWNKEEDTTYADDKHISHAIQDENRRSLLKSIILSSSTITSIITTRTKKALAEDTDLLEIDQQKVVMQLSAKNIPQKYGSTTTTSSSTSDHSSNTSSSGAVDESGDSWMTDVETRRIDVFEKAAPSVVFIDTYVETRDAFSTNV